MVPARPARTLPSAAPVVEPKSKARSKLFTDAGVPFKFYLLRHSDDLVREIQKGGGVVVSTVAECDIVIVPAVPPTDSIKRMALNRKNNQAVIYQSWIYACSDQDSRCDFSPYEYPEEKLAGAQERVVAVETTDVRHRRSRGRDHLDGPSRENAPSPPGTRKRPRDEAISEDENSEESKAPRGGGWDLVPLGDQGNTSSRGLVKKVRQPQQSLKELARKKDLETLAQHVERYPVPPLGTRSTPYWERLSGMPNCGHKSWMSWRSSYTNNKDWILDRVENIRRGAGDAEGARTDGKSKGKASVLLASRVKMLKSSTSEPEEAEWLVKKEEVQVQDFDSGSEYYPEDEGY